MPNLFTIKNTHIFHGPNTYAHSPIILVDVDIEIDSLLDSKSIVACQKIVKIFPEWFEEDIDKDLSATLYIGTVLSSIGFGLLHQNHDFITPSGAKLNTNGIYLWVGFHQQKVSIKAIELAFQILQYTINNDKVSKDTIKKHFTEPFGTFCKQYCQASAYLIKMSYQNDIPFFPYLDNSRFMQYGWGINSRVFLNGSSMDDSYYGVSTSMNKLESKKVLQSIGIPVANSVTIHSIDQLQSAIEIIGFPCVVKPIRGAQGIGITANIQNINELTYAYNYAKRSAFGNNAIMLEAFIQGDDYRIMVANGKYLATLQRRPSYVIGNGILSVQELIYKLNKLRADINKNPQGLKPVLIEKSLIDYLNKQHIELATIISVGEKVLLSSIASYSAGGLVHDVTDITHPQVKHMVELIAQASNIATLGVDYLTTDISKPCYEVNGAVTEYNHLPSLSLLNFSPSPEEAFQQLLNIGSGRIPLIIAIIDPVKFAETREWLKDNVHDQSIGWVCGNNVSLGQYPLKVSNTSGWETVKMLLRQKALKQAFIVCSSEEITKKGLPVDKANYICLNDVKISLDWSSVLQATTTDIREFNTLSSLLSFSLEELLQ